VVLVDPLAAWDEPGAGGPGAWEVRYRLVDLRTSTGFRDENGRQLEAATVEGPAFVFVGRYALYCFPTGANDAWPQDAKAAIAALPPRLYEDERDAEPDRWRRGRHARSRDRDRNADRWAEGSRGGDAPLSDAPRVTGTSGPARARVDGLAESDQLLGTLELASRLGQDSVRVGADSASRGLLLGRYSRCDTAGATSLSLEKISRVHLLVLRIGGALWAVDTASTNGVARDGAGVRVHRLDDGDELSLADGAGAVRWRAVH
jgi:hypothetical protein